MRSNNALGDMRLTRIVVAHRPETIQASKRVITLEKGVVALTTAILMGQE